jgi:hypothetical protein
VFTIKSHILVSPLRIQEFSFSRNFKFYNHLNTIQKVDVCVVGGGSGGFGAAVSAARHNAKTLLIEASPGLGGTSTRAGVNNYEPVAGAMGLPAELYEKLQSVQDAVTIQVRTEKYHPDRPWGIYDRSNHTDYRLTLSRRCGTAVVFEPDAMNTAMLETVEEAGCELLLSSRFTDVRTSNGEIDAITVSTPEGEITVEADVFIDSTADIYLARAAGCQSAIGVESKDAYNEPTAPDDPETVLNSASLCYRISPLSENESPSIDSPPPGIDLASLNPVTSIRTYANGDRNMNPLRLMTGEEAYDLGEDAYTESLRRIKAHWHVLQTKYGFEFGRWKLTWISPMLGIRETHRLVGEHVLTEQDVETPLAESPHKDIVGFADHALDFHGTRPSRQLANGPYGIPFRCLLAKEYENLLVACRGSSYSSIGASTCRLSRTMMVLGQAAGAAAAMYGRSVKSYNPDDLRSTLKSDGVALELQDGYLDAMDDVVPIQEPDW